jgi:threonine/homoserine/homoserine lactone efflux protein
MHVIGAGVLVYLGVTAWRSARREEGEFGDALKLRLPVGRTPAASFRASLVTIAANPKAAVFAFSFFPEFLPRHGLAGARIATRHPAWPNQTLTS